MVNKTDYAVWKNGGGNKTDGTSLQNTFMYDYNELVELFGQPVKGWDKTDAEWTIEGLDGTIAVIYNWKDGKNYCGDEGLDVEDIEDWHIGGFDDKASELVRLIINDSILEHNRFMGTITLSDSFGK